jgi:hypothetical protein
MSALKKTACWVGAAAGVGVPAVAVFAAYAPPLFPAASAIITAVADAIVFYVVGTSSKPSTPDVLHRRSHRAGIGLILLAVALLSGYGLYRDYTSVPIPSTDNERLQIGFGTNDWSLTDAGKDWKRRRPQITSEQIVQGEGYTQDRVYINWTRASVYMAATLMFLLFFMSFLSWTTGFALLARETS